MGANIAPFQTCKRRLTINFCPAWLKKIDSQATPDENKLIQRPSLQISDHVTTDPKAFWNLYIPGCIKDKIQLPI